MKKTCLVIAFLAASFAAFSQTNKAVQCTATAKSSGLQCRRMTTDPSQHCWQHGGVKDTSDKQVATQCSATAKSSGLQCRNKTTNQGGVCHLHMVAKN